MDFRLVPKNFCKEYVAIRGTSAQIIQLMATVLGIKRAFDDWIDVNKIHLIQDLAQTYDLTYMFDWVFQPCEDTSNVVDGKKLNTTKMYGQPYSKDVKEGYVHVFFAKKQRDLELAYKNGWYPLIMNNRAVHKPYIDLLRFGYFLGYPECCIDFFRRYNDHSRYNNLYETYKHTKGDLHMYCNSILKDHTFSYIYHIPCSFNCPSTIAYVTKLRKAIMEQEEAFIKKVDEMITKPLLVFNEQDAYIFEGNTNKNVIRYSDVNFVGKDSNQKYLDIFKKGDTITVGKKITTSEEGRVIKSFKKDGNDGFILNFKGGKDAV